MKAHTLVIQKGFYLENKKNYSSYNSLKDIILEIYANVFNADFYDFEKNLSDETELDLIVLFMQT